MINEVADQPAGGMVDPYSTLFRDLQTKAGVPDASLEIIDQSHAIFQAMYLDLGVLKKKIADSMVEPPIVTIYADVLCVPDNLKWPLAGTGLVVYARRMQVGSSVQVFLDYRQSQSSSLVLFTKDLVGSLDALAVIPGQAHPVVFPICPPLASPGLMINWTGSAPAMSHLPRASGMSVPVTDTFTMALDNSFIFGSLLVDQDPALALDILTWVKDWAAESSDLLRLFLRSSSLVALLSSQIDAHSNGSTFVPYLTSAVYTNLAQAFVAEAKQYESDYMQLSTQKALSDENIQLAKTLLDNAQYQSDYVQGLKTQAKRNYDNANAAVATAQKNFGDQQLAVKLAAANFREQGLPEYERAKIAGAVFSLVTAAVTFGGAIAAMMVGQEEAAPAAATGAADAAKTVAEAADTGAEVAKMANGLAEQMKTLQKLVEALQKVYEFSQAVMTAASNIQTAESMMSKMQSLDVDTGGVDISASDQWDIYKLKTDAVLQVPIDAEIEYADEYKQAIDIMIIYGQSLAGAQVAAVRAGQELARVLLQEQLAKAQQQRLTAYVDSLKAGEEMSVAVMQQFYQRYLDSKSSLLAALENYRASYFYWALALSSVKPAIIDNVNSLETGLQSLTAITMDNESALNRFDPAPQKMVDKECIMDDPVVIASLCKNNTASWPVSLDNDEFLDLDRVRLTNVRVWLEGAKIAPQKPITIAISTSGSYRDRLNGTDYQFTAKPLKRLFEYRLELTKPGRRNPDWSFENGDLGYVEIDGAVADEVSYAYFEPTPFTEWTITLSPHDNPGLDLSQVTKITMQFQGSAIYTSGHPAIT